MVSVKSKIKNVINLLRTKEKIPIMVPTTTDCILKNKTILITGGSSGIGQTMALQMSKAGGKVIIAGRNESKLKKICEDITGVEYIVLDVSDIKSFEEKIESLNKNIDILVNCAGVNDMSTFLGVNEEIFDRVMDTNLKGAYFLSQVIAKKMIENNIKGHILNVSSASSLRPASTPYAISKWALTGMTKGLADVLIPYGITVNAIAPGPTATPMLGREEGDEIGHDMTPCGRYATTQEIANLAVFMVSDMGDLIVGDTFYISGGSGTVSLHR